MPKGPEPTNDVIRVRMERQRRRDTNPELAVRRELHQRGIRYRVDVRPEPDLRMRGDIVWPRHKVIVMIDGCYWHGCPVHGTFPKNNAQWWREKIDANIKRDRRHDIALRQRGWTVMRFWEHEDPVHVADAIETVVHPESKEAATQGNQKVVHLSLGVELRSYGTPDSRIP